MYMATFSMSSPFPCHKFLFLKQVRTPSPYFAAVEPKKTMF